MFKLLFGGLLLGSMGLNIYLLNAELVVKDDLDSDLMEVNDAVAVAQSSVKIEEIKSDSYDDNIKKIRESFMPSLKKERKSSVKSEKKKEAIDFSAYEESHQKSKKEWKGKLFVFLDKNLELHSGIVENYLEINKDRESEIDEYLAGVYENLEDNQTYYMTLEDGIFLAKINKKYLNQLKEAMGVDSYEEYIKFRVNYNNKLVKSGNHNFRVEF